MRARQFFSEIKKDPKQFYLIHYSSESLYGDNHVTGSLRITSIAVMQFENKQTKSFSLHAAAEELGIEHNEIEDKYSEIEKEILRQFINSPKAIRHSTGCIGTCEIRFLASNIWSIGIVCSSEMRHPKSQ